MTPMQDIIALVAAVSASVLLFASAPAQLTLPKVAVSEGARPLARGRRLSEEDLARLCADTVVLQKMGASMQDSIRQLELACGFDQVPACLPRDCGPAPQ